MVIKILMVKNTRGADPDIWGPGKWDSIHTLGAFCNDEMAKKNDMFVTFEQFKASIICLLRNIPCDECLGHAQRYLSQNPITTNLLNYSHPQFGRIGPFVWTWKFHSAVNARKQKSNLDLDTAWRIYHQEKCADGRCRDISIATENSNRTTTRATSTSSTVAPSHPANSSNSHLSRSTPPSNSATNSQPNTNYANTPYRRASDNVISTNTYNSSNSFNQRSINHNNAYNAGRSSNMNNYSYKPSTNLQVTYFRK